MLNKIIGWFLGYDSGHFHLYQGKHEVYIPTNISPAKVWVRCISHGTDGCGQIPMNWVSYQLMDRGILFNVDVKTNKCTIQWFAVC